MPDFAEILYKVRVAVLQSGSQADPARSLVRYGVDFAVSPQDVKLETAAGGLRSGSIEVDLIAYNYDGKVLNAITRKIPYISNPMCAQRSSGSVFSCTERSICPRETFTSKPVATT